MANQEERAHRACFTGHRPEKLRADKEEIIAALRREIDTAIADGITEFISGMARGVDLWAANLVLERKKSNPSIRLLCAIPYENFEKGWSKKWQDMYHMILEQADMIHYVQPNFTYAAFQERNHWMVDHAIRVIAVFNGEQGGTKNTLEYAGRFCLELRIIPG